MRFCAQSLSLRRGSSNGRAKGFNSFRDGLAARATFKGLKLRKTAKSGRYTSERHRLAAIRAMRCFGGGVHFCFISPIGTAQSAL